MISPSHQVSAEMVSGAGSYVGAFFGQRLIFFSFPLDTGAEYGGHYGLGSRGLGFERLRLAE